MTEIKWKEALDGPFDKNCELAVRQVGWANKRSIYHNVNDMGQHVDRMLKLLLFFNLYWLISFQQNSWKRYFLEMRKTSFQGSSKIH